MNDIKNNINKIETNIEVPADNTDSVNQEHQRDEWGKFLNNKTFKIMKDNFNLLKSNILSLIDKITDSVNTQNTEIKKTNDSLKIVSDKVNDLSNGNLTLPNNVALLNKKNVFTDNVSVKSLSLDNNNIIKETVNNLEVGNATKNINIIGFGEKLLYNGKEIEGGSSSDGEGSSNVNLSGMLGVPVIAETYSRLSLPTLTIKKSEVLNAIVYTNESDYTNLVNGTIKIPSLEFNRNANGYNQDTPLVKFNRWNGDTTNNYFIPNNQTSNLYEAINQLLGESISLVPFNNIYGASFSVTTKITKSMDDETKKVIEGTTNFRLKYDKSSVSNINDLKAKKYNFDHIYSTGYDYGDFLKLLEFNKVENTSISSELCFKMNLSGARNDLGRYDVVNKTMSNVDTYTVFYITNTRDLFEGDFTTVKIEFEVNDVKVLLQV